MPSTPGRALAGSRCAGLWLDLALIASFAMEGTSTLSGERPLGVELDTSLTYNVEPGFVFQLAYGALFPLSGFRNVTLGLGPEPAHTMHLLLAYRL